MGRADRRSYVSIVVITVAEQKSNTLTDSGVARQSHTPPQPHGVAISVGYSGPTIEGWIIKLSPQKVPVSQRRC